jgi:hypothetical protein
MEPVLVTKRPRGIAARSGTARALAVACTAALLVACGAESPQVSRPEAHGSKAPQNSAAPSSQQSDTPSSTAASTSPRPGQCVATAPPTGHSSQSLDNDVCKVTVRHTQDRIILEAKVDPTGLSRWTEFHGYFQTPGWVWSWVADFPKGADESHYLLINDDASGDLLGCFSGGRDLAGSPIIDESEFTATVNRQDGTFKAFIPRLCLSEAGARVSPEWIRASVNYYRERSHYDYGSGRAHFTDRLYPGDVAIQRR